MNRTTLTKEMRVFTGKGTITNSELSLFLGDSNLCRVKKKYLNRLLRIGRAYLIPDVAERLMEHTELEGWDYE